MGPWDGGGAHADPTGPDIPQARCTEQLSVVAVWALALRLRGAEQPGYSVHAPEEFARELQRIDRDCAFTPAERWLFRIFSRAPVSRQCIRFSSR